MNPRGSTPRMHTITTRHLRVHYPDDLQRQEVAGTDLTLVADLDGAQFTPSLVVASAESSAPLIDAAALSRSVVMGRSPDSQLLAVDLFMGPSSEPQDVPIGRIHTYIHPASSGLDVIVKDWIIATGSQHLRVTASFLPSQARAWEGVFNWIANNVEILAAPDDVLDAARGVTESDTAIDEPATERVGYPLEDLHTTPARGRTRGGVSRLPRLSLWLRE